jgi:hypothetical protein
MFRTDWPPAAESTIGTRRMFNSEQTPLLASDQPPRHGTRVLQSKAFAPYVWNPPTPETHRINQKRNVAEMIGPFMFILMFARGAP